MKRARPHSSRAGSALVFALIAVSVVSMLAAAYLRVSAAVTRVQQQEVENTRAFYLAEAGLAEAYQGLRIGKTGQVASGSAPARFGQGLVWVDATAQVNGRVRLESTGMSGSGRSTLALVVEPVELSLGFFSDEDLVIDDVLLVDGYDSDEGEYIEQIEGQQVVIDWSYPYLWNDEVDGLLFQHGSFYRYHAVDGDVYTYDLAVSVQQLSEDPLYDSDSVHGIGPDDFMDDDWEGDFETHEIDGVRAYFAAHPHGEAGEGAAGDALAVHTAGGGQVGSNGSIAFVNTAGDSVAIYGDVVPGVGESVSLGDDAAVTGATEPRTEPIDLPAVEVPVIDTLPAVLHDSPIPMVISPSSIGYAGITVAADAELIVRGPCTLVIGMLELEPGADMLLDTTDGEVTLFVTGGLNLAPDSTLQTSGEQPDEISIQVGEIAAPVGDAPVKLESTAQFHGTIYSPNSAVRVGSSFEVFGAMVAKSLELAPGVRLHFDNAGFDGSPLPKIVRWSIVEIPAVARRRGDPLEELDVESLAKLSDAHDLTGVWLRVSYLDHSDNPRTYEGLEADFDWDVVAEVIQSERAKDVAVDEPVEDPPRTGVRTSVADILSASVNKDDTTAALIAVSPLSQEELDAAKPIIGPAHYNQLVNAQ